MKRLLVATLFPLATVAAGDEANAPALARRARARALACDLVSVDRAEDVPDADIYLLGGTGRASTGALVELLGRSALAARVADGDAVVFAVDAGLDALARTWVDPDGESRPGLGLIGADTTGGPAFLGTMATLANRLNRLPAMVGWISSDVRTLRDPGTRPLAHIAGYALSPGADSLDGVDAGGVVATRLHGPVLALNPELADLLLSRALGSGPWPPLPAPAEERARAERLAELRMAAAAGRSARRRRARP